MCVSAERQQRKQEREKQRDRFHTEALRSLISHRTGRRSLPEPFRSPRDGIYIVESLPTGLEQAARAFGEILHKPSNVGCGCQNSSRSTGERAGRSWSRPTPASSRLPAPPADAASENAAALTLSGMSKTATTSSSPKQHHLVSSLPPRQPNWFRPCAPLLGVAAWVSPGVRGPILPIFRGFRREIG